MLAHAPAQHHDGDRWNCESAKQVVHVGILVAQKAAAILGIAWSGSMACRLAAS
jgi:hypothetical protein